MFTLLYTDFKSRERVILWRYRKKNFILLLTGGRRMPGSKEKAGQLKLPCFYYGYHFNGLTARYILIRDVLDVPLNHESHPVVFCHDKGPDRPAL